MPDTQISEEMCLAAAKSDYAFDGRGDWDKASRIDRERYCERTKKGLEAATSGYAIVPREPTQAMLDAGYYPAIQRRGAKSVWQCMIQVAPPVASGHVVGWRTMDSAPKDGTEIMVAGGKFYSTADDWKTEYEHTDWNLASWRDGGWQGERDEQYDTYYYYKPTHWMPKVPLPAPPVPEMEG